MAPPNLNHKSSLRYRSFSEGSTLPNPTVGGLGFNQVEGGTKMDVSILGIAMDAKVTSEDDAGEPEEHCAAPVAEVPITENSEAPNYRRWRSLSEMGPPSSFSPLSPGGAFAPLSDEAAIASTSPEPTSPVAEQQTPKSEPIANLTLTLSPPPPASAGQVHEQELRRGPRSGRGL
eukprot:CAMPEP_0170060954 /NCGR_PEP_ID=MMETSP0019_2-20121128/2706_1 /TAXON_ID=98059 /ORGANISM="Dinobryon sp., Strain UTEXLB2267" /LENGTH=174 /DNA_ID=CAMNT_0010266669 /DNA_START=368 /DNA_END=889 /DNA_ORIENTATION=+